MTIEPKILAELKEKLEEEKKQLENELVRIAKPTNTKGAYETNFNEIGSDEDENASEVEEYTDNLALEENLEKQLKDVMDALGRMTAGTYGKCVNCNEEIPLDRLMVYPAAKNCINCKN